MEKEVKIHFYKGRENILAKDAKEEKEALERIKESFGKVLDGKNLSFLLGSGCSSLYVNKSEVGIPTMMHLAKEFYNNVLKPIGAEKLKTDLKIDVKKDQFKTNLEFFLGTLHSAEFYFENSEGREAECKLVKKTIKQVKEFLIEKILNENNRSKKIDSPINDLYEKFYRKLLYRNTNLPKANIFTTNYDLYSEYALDRLGIHYVNGFTGGINKYFNPTIFNYALAEKMDLSQSKWNVIDNFFYLYKIHGSINWIQDKEASKLFQVREIQNPTFENLKGEENIMIHPTPLKQNASLGSPYSDLFREFQKKLMQNNNVLVTIGYSFSDEHINNIIYQAFTIPTFRLIVLGTPTKDTEIDKLKLLDDPRVWVIGGDLMNGDRLHYFKGFIDNVLPDLSNDDIDDKIENAIKVLLKRNE